MADTELMRLGQIAKLRERRLELAKRFERTKGDVLQYTFPTDPLNPIGTCQLELAAQAMKELVGIQAEYLQIENAIAELGG